MTTTLRLPVASLVLAATPLLVLACSESRSPTEPATPTSRTSLSGVVSDLAGVPLGGLTVECQGRRGTTLSAGGPVGSYALAGLRSGRTTVHVYQPGQERPSSFDVELSPGSNVRDLSVPAFHGEPASMSGVVTISSSRPIAGVFVWCQARSAPVAADGSYALSGLESGYWGVSVVWNSYDEHAEAVTLEPGPNTANFSIPY